MAKWETDILVVGAGPAGSIAAREAAGAGARAILIERKSTVGIPVQCAEYVPVSVREFTGALMGSVVQKVKGIRTFIQQREAAYTKAPGYIVERSVFDQNLACEARNQGAGLLLNTVLLEKSPHGVVLSHEGKKLELKPKIIIGGDGPRSLTAGWINRSGPVLAAAAQYTMELDTELEDVEIYLDLAFPGGYAWLFPKGQFCNLGVAVDPRFGAKVLPALHYFLELVLKEGKLRSTQPVRKTGGFIPISGPLPATQKENILLVGDAGGFTHPITGGGILHALITGQLAGKIAAQALKKANLTLLEQYEANWQNVLGPTLGRGNINRDYLNRQWQALGQTDFQLLARQTWIAFPEYFRHFGGTCNGGEGKRMESSDSPKYIQTSLAAAITLNLKKGNFYRDARLNCLNLLLSYEGGCKGRCAYCGLAKNRNTTVDENTFIRVKWPKYEFEAILGQAKKQQANLKRVCVAMVTNPRALDDCNHLVRRLKQETGLLISALVTPTLIRNKSQIVELKENGADSLGIAVDTATEELFEGFRGLGVQGPHQWAHYWQVVQDAVDVFGANNVSVHLIVGLGETEADMVEVIQRVHQLKAVPHLFAFYPEKGSPLEMLGQPSIGQYRRIQLARYLIVNGLDHRDQMKFNSGGQLIDFGVNIEPAVKTGVPFMTSGCRDLHGEVACNRPYGNERPGELLYNYPFRPTGEDLELIRKQLWQGLERNLAVVR